MLDETVFLSNFLKFSAVQAIFESYQGIIPYSPDFDVYDYTPESKNYRHLHGYRKNAGAAISAQRPCLPENRINGKLRPLPVIYGYRPPDNPFARH